MVHYIPTNNTGQDRTNEHYRTGRTTLYCKQYRTAGQDSDTAAAGQQDRTAGRTSYRKNCSTSHRDAFRTCLRGLRGSFALFSAVAVIACLRVVQQVRFWRLTNCVLASQQVDSRHAMYDDRRAIIGGRTRSSAQELARGGATAGCSSYQAVMCTTNAYSAAPS